MDFGTGRAVPLARMGGVAATKNAPRAEVAAGTATRLLGLPSTATATRALESMTRNEVVFTRRWDVVMVPQGERFAVREWTGGLTLVDGPRVVLGLGRQFAQLQRIAAGVGEYVRVSRLDGTTGILPGPVSVVMDPLTMNKAESLRGTEILSNETLIVYREQDNATGAKEVKRHVIRGPAVYVPRSPLEFPHVFSWHGEAAAVAAPVTRGGAAAVDSDTVHVKVPHALRFTKLQTTPAQLYYDVLDVRTQDDVLIRVKLMVFYAMAPGNVEKMVDRTSDPIADLINAVSADVICFASDRTFEQFKEDSKALNRLESFPRLVKTGTEIGFEVSAVVNRGFVTAAGLQSMHDKALETRTRLTLDREAEEQRATLLAFTLEKARERAGLEMKLALDQAKHAAEVKAVESLAESSAARLEQVNAVRWAEDLKKAGMDPTPVLVARETKAGTTVVRVEGLSWLSGAVLEGLMGKTAKL